MRLSESIRRGVLETVGGGILNKFQVRKRRSTLFFEDILAKYIRYSERKERNVCSMRNFGRSWALLGYKFLPTIAIKLSPIFILNVFAKRIWHNVGLVDDLCAARTGSVISLDTKSEVITRSIGKNEFSIGTYEGTLSALYNSEVVCTNAL